MTIANEATERQVQAARPNASTWLAANAGSGKTRVLTDRVARLLLSGVPPLRILCLTYTKAAASEMQNRLFQRLGAWAMLDDTSLSNALAQLGVQGQPNLAKARTLFASAIETPGGLKIQTIHSFCANLLRRFPLEAGVSPNFSEMEDRAAVLLRSRIVEDMAAGAHTQLIDDVVRFLPDGGLVDLTQSISQQREAFAEPKDHPAFLDFFGLPPGYTEQDLLSETFVPSDAQLLSDIVPLLAASGSNDARAANKLRGLELTVAALPILESFFLYGHTAKTPHAAKIGAFPTKGLQSGSMAGYMTKLEDLMARVEAARPKRLGLASAEKCAALHAFAKVFLQIYETHKQQRGWLDFDDLILKARALLTDPAVAAWVLFRLDGGIDHILVDEAQDTSPAQWDVIERLAQEFTAGQGARDVERTIFVVGDKKQSIYSFQGADPQAFDRMQAEFARRLDPTGPGLQSLTLEFSFRSSPAILGFVDHVFRGKDAAGFPAEGQHRAFKADLPGRVDLWPCVEPSSVTDDGAWHDPVDRKSPRHHSVILAEQIAQRVKAMLEDEVLPELNDGQLTWRKVQAGDIMILVQSRSDLFGEIIRACKAASLPVAGADRLKVGAELAVRDLGALLSFLSTPEDDLALATALKSPLFGWTENDLYRIAYERGGGFLWTALRERAEQYPETLGILTDLMGQTDFLRPYDLIERVLIRHDGRRRLLGRLGDEAEDGIDALLSQALAYERTGVPSLTGFLSWMQADDLTIKREMGSAGNLIRVMTVHGSKGLESPIVILPDTGKRRAPGDPNIFDVQGTGCWKSSKEALPPILAAARDEHQARQLAERQRLLYVAMTRAEKWLIVAAAGNLDKNGNTWFQQVEASMKELGAVSLELGHVSGLRYSVGDWGGTPRRSMDDETRKGDPLPSAFRDAASRPDLVQETIAPSDLGGAKALAGEVGLDEATALARGTATHLLLEHLPHAQAGDWPSMTARLLDGQPHSLIDDCLTEARRVLTAPHLAHVFSGDALAEVPVTGTVMGRRMHGVIDRLLIGTDRVTAIDFKSNSVVPDGADSVPEGLLRQMGAYGEMLAQIFPDHRVETAILWTANATLMGLPHKIVFDALQSAQLLDDPS